MIIPYDMIDAEVLQQMAAEFVTSGADQYQGALDRDIKRVISGLETGDYVILFSEEEQFARITSAQDAAF